MALNTKMSDTAANAEANALAPLMNSGMLKIYSGTQPTNANTAITTQTLLVTLTFGATAFGTASAGVITANPITSGTSVAAGTASWDRIFKSDGATVVMDGSVGTSSSNLNLGTTAILLGSVVSVTSFSHTVSE